VFRIPQYVERLTATGGIVPEFVNPKYANEERSIFKSPTRLECMMQDYPKLITESGRVGFTTYPAWYCFSPVKNNVNEALNCFKKGLPSFGAAQGEWEFYNWHNNMLELAGVSIERETNLTNCAGVEFAFGPKSVIEPSFALTLAEYKKHLSGSIKISAKSTFILGDCA